MRRSPYAILRILDGVRRNNGERHIGAYPPHPALVLASGRWRFALTRGNKAVANASHRSDTIAAGYFQLSPDSSDVSIGRPLSGIRPPATRIPIFNYLHQRRAVDHAVWLPRKRDEEQEFGIRHRDILPIDADGETPEIDRQGTKLQNIFMFQS
jgi:hypothetical protein